MYQFCTPKTAKLVPVLDAISRRVNMRLHGLTLTPIFVKPGFNCLIKGSYAPPFCIRIHDQKFSKLLFQIPTFSSVIILFFCVDYIYSLPTAIRLIVLSKGECYTEPFATTIFSARYNIRGTQREYCSKPLKHSIVKRILVFKR